MGHKNKEDRNEYNKQYRTTEKYKEQQKKSKNNRTLNKKRSIEANHISYLKHLFGSCRTRKSGCSLTVEDLINQYDKQNGLCALSGVKMSHQQGKLTSISIDRIDNTIGYTPDNIQLTTKCMNLGRNKASVEEVKEFITLIKTPAETI